ncbi:hypothetical protein EC988_005481, partial [Linderina pennispora]
LRQLKRLYGDDTRFLILQSYQLILKRQLHALVHDLGAPEALIGVVQNLWLMYVSKIENMRLPVYQVEDEELEDAMSEGGQADNDERVTADSLFRQYTQTQDDSLDTFLRNVDEDIVRDEEEMAAWEERHGWTGHEEGTQKAGLEGGSERKGSEWRTKRNLGKGYEGELEHGVHLAYLPAIISLGFAWLRYPFSVGDMIRLTSDESIPYGNVHGLLPEAFRERMGKSVCLTFVCGSALGHKQLRSLMMAFENFYGRHYGIEFSAVEPPILVLSLLKRLNISLQFYPVVMRIVEAANINIAAPKRDRTLATERVLAAIVLALQLHYGLDEVERVASPDTAEFACGLPGLQEFLDRWCGDWEREAAVSVYPALATLDEERLEAYIEYSRRMSTRAAVSITDVKYRELGRKYQHLLDTLGVGSAAGRETAAADEQMAELEKRLTPIRMPCTGTGRSGTRMRQFGGLAQPLEGRAGLESGQLIAWYPYPLQPGYAVAVLGLVIGRCAMLAGISQSRMLALVSMCSRELFDDELTEDLVRARKAKGYIRTFHQE